MSRCKACDKIMSDSELLRRDSITNDWSELCTLCMGESDDAALETAEEWLNKRERGTALY
jgi:hypothetical protein